jgi:transposase, IS30 family
VPSISAPAAWCQRCPDNQTVSDHKIDNKSPWQRGSNENTNGLLRQYLPRTLDFKTLTQADLDAIADQLNGRPRQTPGFKTPSQALAEVLR